MAGPGSRLTRFPLSAAINLHEIHLAPQPSLQVPVGHIPVSGGIKLCSPGTFLVANYLIINNGSFQVNFTKPNSSTIRYTHSKWLREDTTEALVGRVAVPKIGQKPPFATRGWLWSTCGQGGRAEDRSEAPFATQGWLWSTCGQGRRAEDRSEELFATPGWLWSTCGQGRRAKDRPEERFATQGCP